jgi:hypothetical protein
LRNYGDEFRIKDEQSNLLKDLAIQLEKKNSEIEKMKKDYFSSGDKVANAQSSLKTQQDMNAKCKRNLEK